MTALRGEIAMRAAYTAHGPELYRFAMRRLDDQVAAQDAVQEVFLRAWRAGDRYDPQLASLRVWLFAIARNVLHDEMRRAAARCPPVDTRELSVPDRAIRLDERIADGWVIELRKTPSTGYLDVGLGCGGLTPRWRRAPRRLRARR